MTKTDAAELERMTGAIVHSAFKLHVALGPGLLESVYEMALARDLERQGLGVRRQMPISFEYDGMHFENAFRVDIVVRDAVLVEIKSVEARSPVHFKQLLTYLRLMNMPIGLLINFGEPTFKEGIRRVINSRSVHVPGLTRAT